jgi:hypothetical protein
LPSSVAFVAIWRNISELKEAYKSRKRVQSIERAAELFRRLSPGESKAALARNFKIVRATVYRYSRKEGGTVPRSIRRVRCRFSGRESPVGWKDADTEILERESDSWKARFRKRAKS